MSQRMSKADRDQAQGNAVRTAHEKAVTPSWGTEKQSVRDAYDLELSREMPVDGKTRR
ncbi:hypothetical protein AB0F17_65690 [Nonomuraea sp. NPDC026600]|uniref:hypothetical protein n=1 Tax=Nonomuraea sp. NPDC026600 TaxID=3155363 RepID=UPI0033BFF3FA